MINKNLHTTHGIVHASFSGFSRFVARKKDRQTDPVRHHTIKLLDSKTNFRNFAGMDKAGII
jgi:hypothetical protein